MDADESLVRTLKAPADQVRLAILKFFWGPEAEEFRTEEGICAGDVRDSSR